MELSNAEMQLFKADMEASKAEELVGEVEGRLANCWIITAIALLCLLGVTSGVLIIALRRRWL